VTYREAPSPDKYQCALQIRGPGQDFLFLSLSSFSLDRMEGVLIWTRRCITSWKKGDAAEQGQRVRRVRLVSYKPSTNQLIVTD
jgi:hypothetical protein